VANPEPFWVFGYDSVQTHLLNIRINILCFARNLISISHTSLLQYANILH
jgi:hypothetical protein